MRDKRPRGPCGQPAQSIDNMLQLRTPPARGGKIVGSLLQPVKTSTTILGKRYSSGLRFGQQFRQMEARLARNRASARQRAPSILAPLERRATLGVCEVTNKQAQGDGAG